MKRRLLAALAAATTVVVGGSTSAVAAVPPAVTTPPISKVTNVRFGAHSYYDRMVIDIRGRMPGTVRVTKPYSLHYDGSGNPVPLAGRGNVQVTMWFADAHTRYRGPRFIRDLRMRFLHGFALLGDFEATVSFGVTTDVSNPNVRLTKLSNPTRIVVDVWR
ncbi:AMIN-like domain-containing (lipo)protein [Spirillospora albida]|uniref:AMIN-like domain-containing (lipo)protein n=1 Tax=Spirillospora albida TaxID=58123 RepID=UPI0004BFD0DC|nr:hypothetical protein [Spirillospora albida]